MLQMALTLDLGNSNPHFAKFVNGSLESLESIDKFDSNQFQNDLLAISSVKATIPDQYKIKNTFLVSDYFKNRKFLDMPVNYTKTLGQDRLVQSYYLYNNETVNNILLIDAGTFTTLDIVSKNGFQGGYIIPGVEILSQNFDLGDNLYSIQIDGQPKTLLPNTTEEAMVSGLETMLLSFIQKIIKDNLVDKIYITGGKGSLINRILQDSIKTSVKLESNLIHYSLHHFLERCSK